MKPSARTFAAAAALAFLCTPLPGWAKPPAERFNGAGTYYALVEGAAFAESGYVSLVVSGGGAATVKGQLGATKFSLRGTIDATTQQFVALANAANPLGLTIAVVANAGEAPRVEGTLLVNAAPVPFTGPVLVANPVGNQVPAKGRFTAVFSGVLPPGDPLDPTAVPTTLGIARLNVLPRGKLKVDPTLADGRVLPLMTQLAADGAARFWRPLGSTGALTGTLQFTRDPQAESDVTGALTWFKPAEPARKYLPEALAVALSVEGSAFAKGGGNSVLDLSAAELTVAYDAEPVVIPGSVEKNKFSAAAGFVARVSLNRGVGSATGAVEDATLGRSTLRGVVLQKQNEVKGLAFGPSGVGSFVLGAPLPPPPPAE